MPAPKRPESRLWRRGLEILWGVPRRGQGCCCGITEKAHTGLEGFRLGGRTVRPKGGSHDQEEGASWASGGGAVAVLAGRRLCPGDGRGSLVGCDWDRSWEGPVTPRAHAGWSGCSWSPATRRLRLCGSGWGTSPVGGGFVL